MNKVISRRNYCQRIAKSKYYCVWCQSKAECQLCTVWDGARVGVRVSVDLTGESMFP